MKTLVAIVLGFMSAFLIYFMAAMLFIDVGEGTGPSGLFVLVVFFGGWLTSSYLLRRRAGSISKVFIRGALLGAAEWIAVACAGVIVSGRAMAHVTSTSAGSDAAAAGAVIGGGLAAMITGGLAMAMAVLCLIVFVIAYFTGREMADTTGNPTKKCPECAEMVQAEARKCKHCGAVLAAGSPLIPA